MLTDLRWLALEVKDTDRASEFYTDHLSLAVAEATDDEVVLDAGDTDLILRRPSELPRGGIHTHYAFAIPAGEYDRWKSSLGSEFRVDEHEFGHMRSLYVYDPDGNCVELAGLDVDGPGVDGIFEVVLEVADLDRAQDFYADLGFELVDESPGRLRLSGPMDLELWEPRLGIADGRGGVHVDLGFDADDPAAVARTVEGRARTVERLGDGVRITDPDGHVLTVS